MKPLIFGLMVAIVALSVALEHVTREPAFRATCPVKIAKPKGAYWV